MFGGGGGAASHTKAGPTLNATPEGYLSPIPMNPLKEHGIFGQFVASGCSAAAAATTATRAAS